MTDWSRTLSAGQQEAVRRMAKDRKKGFQQFSAQALVTNGLSDDDVLKLLYRLKREGYVNLLDVMSGLPVVVPQLSIIEVVDQLDNPPATAPAPAPRRAHPPAIAESLDRFRSVYPDARHTAFIMMPFGTTRHHVDIAMAIRSCLADHQMVGLRADDREFHDDLFQNVLTYIHGCGFGVAVFERIEADTFNPNVSLEVGHMQALGKPVCLLKDKTLKTLPTDLIGKLYRPFDPQDAATSIPPSLGAWLDDKGLLVDNT